MTGFIGVHDKQEKKIADHNSFPVKDMDGAERQGFNTVFGDRIVGQRVPTLSSQFYYPLASDRATFNLVNGGTVVNVDSQLRARTDAQVNSLAEVQGTFFLRYIPGHEAYCYFTCVYNTPSANSYQRLGLFDGVNGMYIGFQGNDFVIAKIRAGVHTRKVIDLTKVFVDESFDPTLGNVYKISFGYLGFATINYEIMTPQGNWVLLGRFEYPNSSKETHIASTFLPVRAEISNGIDGQAMELSSGSITTGIVDGAGKDPGARRFSFNTPTLISLIAGTNTVFVFRNKTTFATLDNRVNALLTLISSATEGNKPVAWRIIRNATLTTPGTWNDVNTLDSIMEYSSDAVVDPLTGTDLIVWNMAKADSFFEQIKEQLINLRPGETAAIVTNSTLATEILLGFRWEELF